MMTAVAAARVNISARLQLGDVKLVLMSEALFNLEVADLAQVPKGLPLILTLQTLPDACYMVETVAANFLATSNPELILQFNADLLLDYRERRPEIVFKRNRLEGYQNPQLALYLCTDMLGNKFLLLTGFEPDYRWQRFVANLIEIINELEIKSTIWVHGLPMPVPHTRELTKTLSGTLTEFIKENTDWQPTTVVSASVGHVIEHHLTLLEKPVLGCTLLLPNYLSGTVYPGAALMALSLISRVTDLIINTEELLAKDTTFHKMLTAQVLENNDLQEMVQQLEQRYEQFRGQYDYKGFFSAEDTEHIPSAEQLADEFQDFLASSQSDPKFQRDKLSQQQETVAEAEATEVEAANSAANVTDSAVHGNNTFEAADNLQADRAVDLPPAAAKQKRGLNPGSTESEANENEKQ